MNTVEQIKKQIELNSEKVKGFSKDGDVKNYRTLLDALDRLISLRDRMGYSFNNYKEKRDEVKFVESLLKIVRNQKDGIFLTCKDYLDNNDSRIYREWVLSFETIVKIEDKLCHTIKFLQRNIEKSLPQNKEN